MLLKGIIVVTSLFMLAYLVQTFSFFGVPGTAYEYLASIIIFTTAVLNLTFTLSCLENTKFSLYFYMLITFNIILMVLEVRWIWSGILTRASGWGIIIMFMLSSLSTFIRLIKNLSGTEST